MFTGCPKKEIGYLGISQTNKVCSQQQLHSRPGAPCTRNMSESGTHAVGPCCQLPACQAPRGASDPGSSSHDPRNVAARGTAAPNLYMSNVGPRPWLARACIGAFWLVGETVGSYGPGTQQSARQKFLQASRRPARTK